MDNTLVPTLSNSVDVEVKDYTYDWVIKNYGPLYRNITEKIVESPPIIFDVDESTEWLLRLIYSDNEFEIIEVHLKKGTLSGNVTLELFTLDKDNNVMSRNKKNIGKVTAEEKIYSLLLNHKLVNLSDSALKIRFKVTYHYLISNTSARQKRKLIEFNEFEKLLDNNKFSDAQITVGDHVFNVHKCILDIRSQYFSAMFSNEMKENRDSKVEITDVKPEVMQEILRFIYTNKVNNLGALKIDLYIASDKYMIESLKNLCEEALIQDFQIENILDTLILADKYELNDLRVSALKFFKTHKKTIMATNDFKTAIQSGGLPTSIIIDLIEH